MLVQGASGGVARILDPGQAGVVAEEGEHVGGHGYGAFGGAYGVADAGLLPEEDWPAA